ncbi:MAG: DUF6398 domain-containing protein [Clostridiales bacterium]|jgi:hypothetical protein|nr:DUF6398 domain-containing protein [Clostridiales bacterium]
MEIAKVIEAYCDLKLTAGYKEVCLEVLAKLARKRPSPLVSGRVNTWACGIVYTVGSFYDYSGVCIARRPSGVNYVMEAGRRALLLLLRFLLCL